LIQKRGGTYYFRQSVPTELREIIGRKEIVQSLKTKDPAEAKRLARAVADQVEARFMAARVALNPTPAPTVTVSLQEAKQHALVWLSEFLEQDELRRANLPVDLTIFFPVIMSFKVEGAQRAFARGEHVIVRESVLSYAARHGLDTGENSPTFRALSHTFLSVLPQIAKAIKARNDGVMTPTPSAPSLAPTAPFSVPPSAAPSRGLSLAPVAASAAPNAAGPSMQGLYERWAEEAQPSIQTSKEWSYAVRRFMELHGDIPAASVGIEHAREFKAALLKLPRGLNRVEQKLPLPVLLKTLKPDSERPTIAATTVNKYITGLISITNWARDNGYVTANPFQGIKVKGARAAQPPREKFTTDDLKAIFSSPIYTEGARPLGGKGEAAFWLPLLALFSGARLEELGQLLVSDVRQEEGVWLLDINDKGGKKVKTANSRRQVPIHPELIRFGFLRYADERRGQDGAAARMFPLLEPRATGVLTAIWSKWFAKEMTRVGITDSAKVFHSFRHTFKAACRRALLGEEVHDALTGHGSVSKLAGRGYGGGMKSDILVLGEEIARVAYPELDLSFLHKTP
jgi:integrase